jgi:hypothetical protein
MHKIVLPALVVLGLSTAAMAQEAAPDFATLDADASGGLSLTEVQGALPDVTAEAFAAADLDASGELSEDEFATLSATSAPAM